MIESKSESKSETKSETKSESKSESQSGPKPESNTNPHRGPAHLPALNPDHNSIHPPLIPPTSSATVALFRARLSRLFLRPHTPEPVTLDSIFAVADDAPARPRRRKNTKRTGELGEAAFLYACILRGLNVAKPWGDSARFDFLVQAGRGSSHYHRVQVKCTESLSCSGYQVQSTYCDRTRKGKYTARDIDFLVGYVIPHGAFYIIPIADCPPSANLRFYPKGSPRKRAPFERFREAWHLLRW
jgi:hypothetical protein